MALTPLADNPQKDNGTPLNGGLNVRSAQSYIEQILDDDGRSPGDGQPSNRDLNGDDSHVELPENDNLDSENNQNGDLEADGNTGDLEGDGDTDLDSEDSNGEDLQADSDQADAEPITNLTQLAEALEMPIDELKSALTHTFKAAGEEHTVTLSDLETGYQLKADYDRNKGKLAEQRKAFEDEQKLRIENFQNQSTALAQSFALAERMLLEDYNSPAMNDLRLTNPTEWLIKQREGEQRLNQLNHARQNAAAQYEQVMNDERSQFLAREGKILADSVEDWGDDKMRSAVDTIKTLGFNDAEVVNLADSRLIKGALELQTLRAENKRLNDIVNNAAKTVKKVKKEVPKVVSGGKLRVANKGGVKRSDLNKLKKRLRQSGDVRDAANLIENLLE